MAGDHGIAFRLWARALPRLWIAGVLSLAVHGLALSAFANTDHAYSNRLRVQGSIERILPRAPISIVLTSQDTPLVGRNSSPEQHQVASPEDVDTARLPLQQSPDQHFATDADKQLYSSDMVDEKAKVSRLSFPENSPAFASDEMTLRARIIIGSDGNAEGVEYLDATAISPELTAVIEDSIMSAKYEPAYIAKKAVKSWIVLQLQLVASQP
ncbi:MAG: hypothetical protein HYU74_06155 [Dechloromonas sp.]|nr:hypothetical protein [Dechloromonas sp.]